MIKAKEPNLDNMLEGKENNTLLDNIDMEILSQAKNYNVDLNSLENVQEQAQVKKTTPKPAIENALWADMDVRLADMVNLVFNGADYPVFIVQDDALIYINNAAEQQLKVEQSQVLKKPFLELVSKDDWNLLAENIGEMLTSHRHLRIRFGVSSHEALGLNLRAIYLPDIEHFSFILLGEPKKSVSKGGSGVLYDEPTGLPSFFLFEDRLQMALVAEHAKEDKQQRNLVACVGINIDNISDFAKINLASVVIKRTADNLVFNLPKTVTVAIGLKYHFWLLLSGLKNDFELDFYLRRVKEILDAGIKDNFMRHDLRYSIGVSVAPQDADAPKKMVEHTVAAVRQAQEASNNTIVIYDTKKQPQK